MTTQLSTQTLRDISDIALKHVRARKIDAAEVSLRHSTGFSVTARNGDVETLEHQIENSFGVTVIHQQCTGYASSSDFSTESIIATLDKAITFASFAQKDVYAGLADPALLNLEYPNCDLSHAWPLAPSDAIQMAIACEKKACAYDSRIIHSEGASVATAQSHIVYANTLGFTGEYRASEHSVGVSCVAREGDEMERDGEYTVARNPHDLWAVNHVAKRAGEKTVARLSARRLKTQTCPVIYEASVARSLLGAFVQAISGGSLYRQSSFLLNALHTQVFPPFIDIIQQPHLPSAMGSRAFDGDGIITRHQPYVNKGELVNYVLGSYSARKLGMQTTGNAGGVFNLSISHSDLSLTALIKKMNRGLLVTDLMGQGVNITTGDYSRGCSGFWIDNGEIQFPVHEITIAGNVKNMLMGIIAVGNDVDERSGIRTGSILIDQMTVAGE